MSAAGYFPTLTEFLGTNKNLRKDEASRKSANSVYVDWMQADTLSLYDCMKIQRQINAKEANEMTLENRLAIRRLECDLEYEEYKRVMNKEESKKLALSILR